jgi:hypothetical protein
MTELWTWLSSNWAEIGIFVTIVGAFLRYVRARDKDKADFDKRIAILEECFDKDSLNKKFDELKSDVKSEMSENLEEARGIKKAIGQMYSIALKSVCACLEALKKCGFNGPVSSALAEVEELKFSGPIDLERR